MQPPLGSRRQIEQPLRAAPSLAYEKLSDPILVKRAKDGDRRALTALCERHAPRVERLTAQIVADPEDARDAAQEALAKLCLRIGQFRGESLFSTWLYRLVVNTCRDAGERQRARRWEPLLEDRRVAPEGDPAACAALAELRAELGRELASISPAQARVVVLKHAFDYSFEEIASESGMPVGTAKCHAHRGRKSLRQRLGAREVA